MFYYPTQNATWLVESDDSMQTQVKKMETLEKVLCGLLYGIHRQTDPYGSDVDQNKVQAFCMSASRELIFGQKDLSFIFADDEPEEAKKEDL